MTRNQTESVFPPGYLPAYLDEWVNDSISALINQINKVPLRGLGGFDQDAVMEFSDGLNIVNLISGGGKTRLLRWIAQGSERCPVLQPLVPFVPFEAGGQSFGQSVLEICRLVLDLSPADACILMDDVLGFLDASNTALFIRGAEEAGKQVILTVKADATRETAFGTNQLSNIKG